MASTTRAQLFVTLLGLLAGGCFDPEPPPCMTCSGLCPTGQTCVADRCESYKDECLPAPRCADKCCVGESCIDLQTNMPPPTLWLDWTSFYQDEPLPVWSDRSLHAHPFKSAGWTQRPDSAPPLERNVLRISGAEQHLISSADTFALEKNDFLLMVASSPSCKSPVPEEPQILVTRLEKTKGLRLSATRSTAQKSAFEDCDSPAEGSLCFSAIATGVACDQMQLFTLRRFTPDAPDLSTAMSQFELRRNAAWQANTVFEADKSLEGGRPLNIGGRSHNSLIGDIALVALFVGKVGDRERCQLERFAMQQLAAAGMPTAATLPECPAP